MKLSTWLIIHIFIFWFYWWVLWGDGAEKSKQWISETLFMLFNNLPFYSTHTPENTAKTGLQLFFLIWAIFHLMIFIAGLFIEQVRYLWLL